MCVLNIQVGTTTEVYFEGAQRIIRICLCWHNVQQVNKSVNNWMNDNKPYSKFKNAAYTFDEPDFLSLPSFATL